ncbi:putative TetR family transcriptional regulator [Streptomyces sp. NBRC 110611]|uniref:TetR/AcrR family transcriptional regulator n=1 Tax=Streptomyces sp. NBRC 110611 TaxID=1621259 RepID=UPI000857157D|nr:TetR family transcriptional regulator [Streptomyces sp. NBRC 110611]GAU67768.1 putative TetR family transcriptional regulator [Streptomyces sp. NBRC 110611]
MAKHAPLAAAGTGPDPLPDASDASDDATADGGTRPRSAATRAAILASARDRFAADGYDRATIRAIARDAGIDPSMVMRYYGNKAGLFAAASEIVVNAPDLTHVPHDELGSRLVRHFLERWESDETMTGMLRVGATNEAGAERMRGVFAEQVGPILSAVCPVPEEAEVRSALIASQMLGLALCRYVLHIPPAVALSHDEVIAWVAPTVQRYLTAETP